MKITYKATGYVYGHLWGGGTAFYKAKPLEADTLEELETKVLAGIEDNTLDSGMGYETLTGAALWVKPIKTVVIDGETFTNDNTFELIGYGTLPEKFEDFLFGMGF